MTSSRKIADKYQKFEVHVVKDHFENYRIHKENLPDLPMRLLIIGKSDLSGKSNEVDNLLLRPMDKDDRSGKLGYKNDFKGEDIYLFSASHSSDEKLKALIKAKGIPASNIFDNIDEGDLAEVYKRVEDKYGKAVGEGERPVHSLVVFDDCSYGGGLKKKINGIISKIFSNGRHILLSSIITAQKYTTVSTTCRENMSALILFQCSDQQLKTVYNDLVIPYDYPTFREIFEYVTEEPHSFMVYNTRLPKRDRILDVEFIPFQNSIVLEE
jgi:hypothetical protein